jgi:hypothetical protein
MRPLQMLIVAVMLTGCGDHAPTSVPGRVARPAEVEGAARLAIDDVVVRIVPALGSDARGTSLATALSRLARTLDSGQGTDGPALARMAQAEVERYARLYVEALAELDAIRLALAVVIGTPGLSLDHPNHPIGLVQHEDPSR